MAVINVLKNGNAPSSAQIGDTVRTAGGNFRIVPANTAGATFNKSSGFWSVRDTTPEYLLNAKSLVDYNNKAMSQAAERANEISQASAAKQYAYNSAEAQKNRDWQEYMSNTAHQREVKDLIAAGLNPVLSATLGGSSTPVGATASGQAFSGQKADVDTNLLNFLGSMYQVAMNNSTQKDIAKIQAETALQTARISSAASVKAARDSASISGYWNNKTANDTGNAKNRVINDVYDFGKGFLRNNASKALNFVKGFPSRVSKGFQNHGGGKR